MTKRIELRRVWIMLMGCVLFSSVSATAKDVAVVLKNSRVILGGLVSMNEEVICISNHRQKQEIPKNEIEMAFQPGNREIIYLDPASDKKIFSPETQELLNRYAIFPDRGSDITVQPFGVYTVTGIGVLEFQTRLTEQTTIAPRIIWIQPFAVLANNSGPTFTGFGAGLGYRYYPWGHISPLGFFIGAAGEYTSASSREKPGHFFTTMDNGDRMDSFKNWAAGVEIGYRFVFGHAFISSASWTFMATADIFYHFDKRYTADGVREVAYGAISPGLSIGIAF